MNSFGTIPAKKKIGWLEIHNFAPVGRSTFISKYNRFEKNCIGVFLEHGSRLHQMKNNWCWLISKPVHVPDNYNHPYQP
jgi:hypothetical protein